jgi:hypothetical protein
MEEPGKALDSGSASAHGWQDDGAQPSAQASNVESADSDRQADSTGEQADGLTPEDETLACAIASGLSQREAGALINRSERTVRRRMRSHAFRQKINDYRFEIREQFVVRLEAALPEAVRTLTEELHGPEAGIRVRASQILLSSGTRVLEREQRVVEAGPYERDQFAAVLRNFVDACDELVSDDLLQAILDRLSQHNQATEVLARDDPRGNPAYRYSHRAPGLRGGVGAGSEPGRPCPLGLRLAVPHNGYRAPVTQTANWRPKAAKRGHDRRVTLRIRRMTGELLTRESRSPLARGSHAENRTPAASRSIVMPSQARQTCSSGPSQRRRASARITSSSSST